MPERFKIRIGDFGGVTALLYAADDRAGLTALLGHGAGADQMSPFMVSFANGLAARGFDVVTFNFLYTESGRRTPDSRDKLETCFRAAIDAASEKLVANKLVIGGKSLGGRIASQLVASGLEGISGLVFLGYPLHPPGKPKELRYEHLLHIKLPMLFVQGERDPFGTPAELEPVIARLDRSAQIYTVEGGDHSFGVPKGWPISQEEVYKRAQDHIARWLREVVLAARL
jgi:hypothetical protein